MGMILVLAVAAVAVASARETDDPRVTNAKSEAAVKKLVEDAAEAYVKADVTFFDRSLAEDYTLTAFDGSVVDKKRVIADLRSGALVIADFKLRELKLRVYGETVVVNGRSSEKAKVNNQDISGDYRFTSVFVKGGDRWQCVATHATLIVQP